MQRSKGEVRPGADGGLGQTRQGQDLQGSVRTDVMTLRWQSQGVTLRAPENQPGLSAQKAFYSSQIHPLLQNRAQWHQACSLRRGQRRASSVGGGRAHSSQGHTPGPPSSAVVSLSEAEVCLLSPVARRLSVRPRTLRRGADTPASSRRVHAHRALPCPTGREQAPPVDLPGLKQDISGVLSQEHTQNVIDLL